MIFKVVKRSKSTRYIPLVMVVVALGFIIAAIFQPAFMVGSVLTLFALLWGYCWSPTGYELNQETHAISIIFPLNRKNLGYITACSREVQIFPLSTLRIIGNGGVFSFSGLFWNRKIGRFRIYSTSARVQDMFEIVAGGQTIFISPVNPEHFLLLCANECTPQKV